MNNPFGFNYSFLDGTMLYDISTSLKNLKEGTVESIKAIGDLSNMIMNAIDWTATILCNPIIIFTFIDKVSLVIIMSLIVLKMLGFHDLEKWILLSILIKIIAMVLL